MRFSNHTSESAPCPKPMRCDLPSWFSRPPPVATPNAGGDRMRHDRRGWAAVEAGGLCPPCAAAPASIW